MRIAGLGLLIVVSTGLAPSACFAQENAAGGTAAKEVVATDDCNACGGSGCNACCGSDYRVIRTRTRQMPQSCYQPHYGCYPAGSRWTHRYPAFHGYYYRRPYNYRNLFDYPWHARMHEPASLFSYRVTEESGPGEDVPPPPAVDSGKDVVAPPVKLPSVTATSVKRPSVTATSVKLPSVTATSVKRPSVTAPSVTDSATTSVLKLRVKPNHPSTQVEAVPASASATRLTKPQPKADSKLFDKPTP
ncbi:MAG: hypothetical protein VB835_06770 [Pirellulales bacterium]